MIGLFKLTVFNLHVASLYFFSTTLVLQVHQLIGYFVCVQPISGQ